MNLLVGVNILMLITLSIYYKDLRDKVKDIPKDLNDT